MELDITGSQATLAKFVADALGVYGGIDVLVNSAGYIESSALDELTYPLLGHERLMRQLNTNIFGPINLTRSLIPYFRAKQVGTLVFIGSQAGWHSNPGASAYCASRSAHAGRSDTLALTFNWPVECLQLEVAALGIKCVVVESGFYRTKALQRGNVLREQSHNPAYAKFNKASEAFEASAFGNEPGDPGKAVERMIDVVMGEGMAKGESLPIRLPLGTDGMTVVKEKCLESLKVCEEWEELIVSTNVTSTQTSGSGAECDT